MRCSRILALFVRRECQEKEDCLKHLSFWEKETQSHGRPRTGTSPPNTELRSLVSTNTPMYKPDSPPLPNSGCGSHWLLSGLVRIFPGCLKLVGNIYSKKSCFGSAVSVFHLSNVSFNDINS